MYQSLQKMVIEHVPRCRRYARAMLGDAAKADQLVALAAGKIVSSSAPGLPGSWVRLWLFAVLQEDLNSGAFSNTVFADEQKTGENREEKPTFSERTVLTKMDHRLASLTLAKRSVYLLTVMEKFKPDEIARIVNIDESRVHAEFKLAHKLLVEEPAVAAAA